MATPTIKRGDLDPVQLTLLADLNKNSPPIFGVNEEFMRQMCIFAGSQPLRDLSGYPPDLISESFDGRKIFDTRSQGDASPSRWKPKVWSTFMNEHAIWESNQRASNFSRTYTITLENESELLFQYQADDRMWVNLNGKQIIDYGSFRPSQQIGSIKQTVAAGTHTLDIKGYNTRGPGGIAMVITLIREFKQNKAVPQIVPPPTSQYVVRVVSGVEKVYIRKRAEDCGPDEDRFEEIEIGSYQTLSSGGGDATGSQFEDTYLYYGRPILPGSKCDGSVDDTDSFWWDSDPTIETPPSLNLVRDKFGKPVQPGQIRSEPDEDLPPITERGCG